MGCASTRKKYIMLILESGAGMIDVETLEGIIIKTSFDEKEIFSLLKKFLELNPSKGKITNLQLMELKNFKYSPFGFHLLEAFGLKKITRKNQQLIHELDHGENYKEEDLTQFDNKIDQILLHDFKEDKEPIDNDENQLDPDVFTVPFLFSPTDENVPSITFSMFCEIMKVFSSHATIDEKTRILFNLYDFDNDGKISEKDLQQYFNNLKIQNSEDELGEVNEVVNINNNKNNQPFKSKKQLPRETEAQLRDEVVREEEEEEKNKDNKGKKEKKKDLKEEEEKNKVNKEEEDNENLNGNMVNITSNNKNINNNKKKNNEINIKKNKTDQEKEKMKKIILLIIKETASNNQSYIDYFDFRNQLLNTQFLLDYNNFLYLDN